MESVRVVVGFDPREAVAYHVFCQSVISKATRPVTFLPIVRQSIPGYSEKRNDGSSAFTYTRFLTPYLMSFKGWAIFCDGDMVCKEDIFNLWELKDDTKAVQVVKHDYVTKANKKYLNSTNSDYPRKNWSSVVIWNCAHPANERLTPEFVSQHDGEYLHRFSWLSDEQIGGLPNRWNWLAQEYDNSPDAALIHFTLGTPCFTEYRNTDFSSDWYDELSNTLEGLDEYSRG